MANFKKHKEIRNNELFESIISKINDELKTLNKKNHANYNYNYIYYKNSNNLNDNDDFSKSEFNKDQLFKLDEEKNKLYGNTRNGFEELKSNLKDNQYISYSNEISIRKIINKNKDSNDDIDGYIFEIKKEKNEFEQEYIDLYNHLKNEIIEILEVKDLKMFDYLLEQKNNGCFYGTIDSYKYDIEMLLNLIYEYNEDIEYKTYIDKLIK